MKAAIAYDLAAFGLWIVLCINDRAVGHLAFILPYVAMQLATEWICWWLDRRKDRFE